MLLQNFCKPVLTVFLLSVLLYGVSHEAPMVWKGDYQEWVNGHPSVDRDFPVVQVKSNSSGFNYEAMLKEATKILETQHNTFVEGIISSVATAVNGRAVNYVRIIGTGSINPGESRTVKHRGEHPIHIGFTSALFQTALGLKIYKKFRNGNRTGLLFQEKNYTEGEREYFSTIGTVLPEHEQDLATIPTSATTGDGVTIAFMLGGDISMTRDLFSAYRSTRNQFVFVGENVNAMDDTFFFFSKFLYQQKGTIIDLLPLESYRNSSSWKSEPFPPSPIYRLFECQECPNHPRNAVQWFEN